MKDVRERLCDDCHCGLRSTDTPEEMKAKGHSCSERDMGDDDNLRCWSPPRALWIHTERREPDEKSEMS